MKVSIVVAALPPQLDGIGDYTANVAAELAKSLSVTLLTDKRQSPEPVDGATIQPLFNTAQPRSLWSLCNAIDRDTPDWVLLQYNPFCYGRWGLNPYLPLAIRAIRQRHPETRVAVMVHEPFVRIETAKFAVMAIWQRWQLWMLGRASSALFISIEGWRSELQNWFPDKKVLLSPVGSNIPRLEVSREAVRRDLKLDDDTIVLGIFGSVRPGYNLKLIAHAVMELKRLGREACLLYIGGDAMAVREAIPDVHLIADGPLSPSDVSRGFAAMDIYLAPFVDGVSTRRTSLMTALQHGKPIASTYGHNTDAALKEKHGEVYLLSAANDAGAFTTHVVQLVTDAGAQQRLGQAAADFYERNFSWPRIASHFLENLA